jgi:hypothetical protein
LRKCLYYFTAQDNGIVKPKIPVKIINPITGDSLRVNALLDSGADSCTIPAMVAKTLGFSLDAESEAKSGTIGISGEKLRTWKHLARIRLLDAKWADTKNEYDVVISILEPKIRIPAIVGTYMFLDNFKVTLNYTSNVISLEW